jgi:hypothetical protein
MDDHTGKPTTIYLDKECRKRLEQVRKETGESFASQVNTILKEVLLEEETVASRLCYFAECDRCGKKAGDHEDGFAYYTKKDLMDWLEGDDWGEYGGQCLCYHCLSEQAKKDGFDLSERYGYKLLTLEEMKKQNETKA